jgi:phage shock protein B
MSTEIAGIIIAPIIVFVVIVLPIWIVLHYVYLARRKTGTQFSSEDQDMMARMVGLLEKMDGRIGTLEKILDTEDPRWRDRSAPADHL